MENKSQNSIDMVHKYHNNSDLLKEELNKLSDDEKYRISELLSTARMAINEVECLLMHTPVATNSLLVNDISLWSNIYAISLLINK